MTYRRNARRRKIAKGTHLPQRTDITAYLAFWRVIEPARAAQRRADALAAYNRRQDARKAARLAKVSS